MFQHDSHLLEGEGRCGWEGGEGSRGKSKQCCDFLAGSSNDVRVQSTTCFNTEKGTF